jgi:Sulfate permease family
LRGYKQAWLRWDILAGLTVAAYLVPQVMAYGVLAGLPPVAGLWAAIPSLALYAFIGSSRQLSVGPESTCAIMTAVVVAPLAAGNPGRYAELAAALAVLVGLLAVVGWLLRLGFVGDLLSAPILVGYLAGIAVIMIIGQLGKVTGVHVTGTSVLGELRSFLTQLDMISWDTVLLSVVTLTFLFVVAWRWPRLPGPLLAVLAVTGITALFHLQEHGVAVVGKLSAGFPPLGLPPLGDYSTLLLPALGVLLVGYTDNVLTGRAFAIRGGYEVDANQEFLALGAANVGAGIFRGMPVSSSGSVPPSGSPPAPAPSCIHSSWSPASSLSCCSSGRSSRCSRPPPLARSSSTPRPGSSTWLSSAGSPGTGAASWCFPWSPCCRCWSSTSSRGSWSPSSSPAPRRCAGSPGRTTRSRATSKGSPACTTSTTTRTRR